MLRREPQRLIAEYLSPLRGLSIFFTTVFLGLTPQAMDLSPLRGSFVGFISAIGIGYPASGIRYPALKPQAPGLKPQKKEPGFFIPAPRSAG